MSVSSTGILCYGFRITDLDGNEDEPDLPYTEDFENFVINLVSSLKEPGSYDGTDPEVKKIWKEYWAKKKKIFNEVGVTLVEHCSYDYPMFILAATESVKKCVSWIPRRTGTGYN